MNYIVPLNAFVCIQMKLFLCSFSSLGNVLFTSFFFFFDLSLSNIPFPQYRSIGGALATANSGNGSDGGSTPGAPSPSLRSNNKVTAPPSVLSGLGGSSSGLNSSGVGVGGTSQPGSGAAGASNASVGKPISPLSPSTARRANVAAGSPLSGSAQGGSGLGSAHGSAHGSTHGSVHGSVQGSAQGSAHGSAYNSARAGHHQHDQQQQQRGEQGLQAHFAEDGDPGPAPASVPAPRRGSASASSPHGVTLDRVNLKSPSVDKKESESGSEAGGVTPKYGSGSTTATYDASIIASLPSPTVVADKDLNITIVNAELLKLFGYSDASELVGKNVRVFIPRDHPHHANHDTYIHNYKNSGRMKLIGTPRVLPAARRDGSVMMVELSLTRAKVTDNPNAAFFVSFRPVLGLAASFEHLNIPVIVLDKSCVITSVNQPTLQMFETEERLTMIGSSIEAFLVNRLSPQDPRSETSPFTALFEDPLSELRPKKLRPNPVVLNFNTTRGNPFRCEVSLSEDRETRTASRYYASLRLCSKDEYSSLVDESETRSDRMEMGSVNPDELAELRNSLQKAHSLLAEETSLRLKAEDEVARLSKVLADMGVTILPDGTAVAKPAPPQAARFPVISLRDLKIKEKIGSGGFAKVYRAIWLGKEVAVKKLRPDINSNVAASFLKEMNLLSSVRHPNVVLMLGACHTNKGDAIVTEYLRGGSLFNHLESLASQSRLLDIATLKKFALDIAMGMAYLHSLSPPIIHRDLKSLNVLIDENNHCKVADFGLSREMVDSGLASASLGTPHWIAPEVSALTIYIYKHTYICLACSWLMISLLYLNIHASQPYTYT